jgi:twitching motility protein PilJ
MFDLFRRRGRRPADRDASPSVLDSQASEMVSSLSDSAFGADALTRPAPLHYLDSDPVQVVPGVGPKDQPLGEVMHLPLLGRRLVSVHQRWLWGGFWLGLVGVGVLVLWAVLRSDRGTAYQATAADAVTETQRLAKSVPWAMHGTEAAFAELEASAQGLGRAYETLLLAGQVGDTQKALTQPLLERVGVAVQTLTAQQVALRQVAEATAKLDRDTQGWREPMARWLAALPANAQGAEWERAAQVAALLERVGRHAQALRVYAGPTPQGLADLDRDVQALVSQLELALEGRADTKTPPARDGAVRDAVQQLRTGARAAQQTVSGLVAQAPAVKAAAEARAALLTDNEPLRQQLETLQASVGGGRAHLGWFLLAPALSALLSVVCAVGLAYVRLQLSRQSQVVADRMRQESRAKEKEARRINDATQAAILRLMNELQQVAEGDLTQQATVTEDITGAIADSVNYTVEELRHLVGQVQSAAQRVTETTSKVENTSLELLAVSTEQLREIRASGQAVLDMAGRITTVSSQAQGSADVARQARQAAEAGAQAVQDTIGGMNTIREQIQETAKRIKRLGESSQEIGETTELISDITEQTTVLALNAAIQAASAGEAGRGFAVVAEEVQRLAERSADATRQIAELVRAIQTDTQDAVQAMERSTREVVEGARLSDRAGHALADIDQLSRQVAELIEQIALSAAREAELAGETAGSIQHIFAVTEQTGEGTRSTVQQVRELAQVASELRRSVERFKIA